MAAQEALGVGTMCCYGFMRGGLSTLSKQYRSKKSKKICPSDQTRTGDQPVLRKEANPITAGYDTIYTTEGCYVEYLGAVVTFLH